MSQGAGSTSVHFDAYSCNPNVMSVPNHLHIQVRQAIGTFNFTIRQAFLDTWDSLISGPCTSFFSLEESHVRVETWPEHGHVNGEVQICNYSQDNRESALALARALLQMLGAKTGEVVVIERGPNRPMCVTDQLSLAEFQECALEPSL